MDPGSRHNGEKQPRINPDMQADAVQGMQAAAEELGIHADLREEFITPDVPDGVYPMALRKLRLHITLRGFRREILEAAIWATGTGIGTEDDRAAIAIFATR